MQRRTIRRKIMAMPMTIDLPRKKVEPRPSQRLKARRRQTRRMKTLLPTRGEARRAGEGAILMMRMKHPLPRPRRSRRGRRRTRTMKKQLSQQKRRSRMGRKARKVRLLLSKKTKMKQHLKQRVKRKRKKKDED